MSLFNIKSTSMSSESDFPFAMLLLSVTAHSQDSTTYVRLNANFICRAILYLFIHSNGDSIEVNLEKGFTHTFIVLTVDMR